jgi:hypothetical protein
MGYEDSQQLDDLIRIATRLRGRIVERREQKEALEKELVRLEVLIASKVDALNLRGKDAEVR